MFACPHCGKAIEPEKVKWWKPESQGPVSLGCGTLILIAVIVSIFSRGGDDDKIRDLRREIQSLEQKIDKLDARPLAAQPPTAEKNP